MIRLSAPASPSALNKLQGLAIADLFPAVTATVRHSPDSLLSPTRTPNPHVPGPRPR